MDPLQRRHRVLTTVAARLDTPHLPWRVDGGSARCDGPLSVFTRTECDGAPAGTKHVELGVSVTARDGTTTVLWDCATALADDEEEAIVQAVDVWADRTMPVFWELFARDGRYATHYPPDDPQGITNWHVIHGGISGWGQDGAAVILQQWLVDHPLLPTLTTLTDAFDRSTLNGVRIFFGGTPGNDTAEIRINGRVDRAASRQLYELPWPRLDKPAYVSTYILAIHPG